MIYIVVPLITISAYILFQASALRATVETKKPYVIVSFQTTTHFTPAHKKQNSAKVYAKCKKTRKNKPHFPYSKSQPVIMYVWIFVLQEKHSCRRLLEKMDAKITRLECYAILKEWLQGKHLKGKHELPLYTFITSSIIADPLSRASGICKG